MRDARLFCSEAISDNPLTGRTIAEQERIKVIVGGVSHRTPAGLAVIRKDEVASVLHSWISSVLHFAVEN